MWWDLFQKNKIVYLFLGGLFAATVGLWAALITTNMRAGSLTLYFLNIGQGDSSLIELPAGEQILIDGGPSGKALLENLAKVLSPQDRYLDLLISTHPQLDHFGGFIEVLKNYEVGAVLGNGRKGNIAAYPELHDQIEENQVPYIELIEGDVITIGEVRLQILSPSPSEVLSGELNDTGLVALLQMPDVTALYTADIGINVEDRLVQKYSEALDVDILKVGHHGSRFSSGDNFLAAASPAVAVIGVGKNTYGHPTKQALSRLEKTGAKVLRTDKDGIVKIILENGKLEIFNAQE